jgi:hypothetical protein
MSIFILSLEQKRKNQKPKTSSKIHKIIYTKTMSATEKSFPTCLPPEAYLRICRAANNVSEPKFRSSVYPKKTETITKKAPQK